MKDIGRHISGRAGEQKGSRALRTAKLSLRSYRDSQQHPAKQEGGATSCLPAPNHMSTSVVAALSPHRMPKSMRSQFHTSV